MIGRKEKSLLWFLLNGEKVAENLYFHGSDLRGLDLTSSNLEGASIHRARIAGAYFPPELAAEEIRLSLKEGIRMRYNQGA